MLGRGGIGDIAQGEEGTSTFSTAAKKITFKYVRFTGYKPVVNWTLESKGASKQCYLTQVSSDSFTVISPVSVNGLPFRWIAYGPGTGGAVVSPWTN